MFGFIVIIIIFIYCSSNLKTQTFSVSQHIGKEQERKIREVKFEQKPNRQKVGHEEQAEQDISY